MPINFQQAIHNTVTEAFVTPIQNFPELSHWFKEEDICLQWPLAPSWNQANILIVRATSSCWSP